MKKFLAKKLDCEPFSQFILTRVYKNTSVELDDSLTLGDLYEVSTYLSHHLSRHLSSPLSLFTSLSSIVIISLFTSHNCSTCWFVGCFGCGFVCE